MNNDGYSVVFLFIVQLKMIFTSVFLVNLQLKTTNFLHIHLTSKHGKLSLLVALVLFNLEAMNSFWDNRVLMCGCLHVRDPFWGWLLSCWRSC